MEFLSSIISNIYNIFPEKYEEQYEVQIRHGGNQPIEEFFDGKYITLQLGKPQTIMDVKRELIKNIKCLNDTCIGEKRKILFLNPFKDN